MTITKLARRYPLGCYFGLVFLVSWGGSLLVGLPIFLRGEVPELSVIGLMAIAMLLAPSLAGILMTWLVDGRDGVRDLFARMARWRVGRWYAALLIFPALVPTVALVLAGLVSPAFAPTIFAIGIAPGLLAGFLEETGWMGFAYPRMRRIWGVLAATLYLALLHAMWHAMAGFLSEQVTFGAYWWPNFIAFSLHVVALRFLIVWVYENTDSLLMAQLMHAFSSGSLAFFIAPFSLSPRDTVIFYFVYGVALLLVAGVVVRYGRIFLGSPPARSRA